MSKVIKINGIEWTPNDEEPKAVAVDMWYDRSRREWVIYTVDVNGYQISSASYGFSKKEAVEIKKELEKEYSI